MSKSSLLAAVACAGSLFLASTAMAETAPEAALKTYGDIAEAMYADALAAAKKLDTAVKAFVAKPSDETLAAARAAWKEARVPYQQTEGFRFGNAIVDDWEGKVNAWPLDEGLIDYVDGSYGKTSDENPLYAANVIASSKIRIGKETVSTRKINKELLQKLHEAGEVEANVAIGYHAIEFLLWGQDLNGTGPGAGNRPASDYGKTNETCTHGNCWRRAEYLRAASDLLVDDLTEMAKNWEPGGAARKELEAKGANGGLATIFTGLGSLSYGELAGERMKLGLILHDPEEEHDCFSDNTHNSHYYDIVGMNAIWSGSYKRTDGSTVSGPSIRDLATEKAPDEAKAVDTAFAATLAKAQVLKDRADSGKEAYDQMIGDGNAEGNKVVQDVVDGLVAQTRTIEALVAKLGVEIKVEGSDSLDNPSAVQ